MVVVGCWMVEAGLLLPRWCGGDSKSVVCWGWHSVGVGEVVVWFVMLLGVWDNLLFLFCGCL